MVCPLPPPDNYSEKSFKFLNARNAENLKANQKELSRIVKGLMLVHNFFWKPTQPAKSPTKLKKVLSAAK